MNEVAIVAIVAMPGEIASTGQGYGEVPQSNGLLAHSPLGRLTSISFRNDLESWGNKVVLTSFAKHVVCKAPLFVTPAAGVSSSASTFGVKSTGFRLIC